MYRKWIGFLANVTLILALGPAGVERSAAGQDNPDRVTRIHQKIDRLRALVKRRQQEGANLEPVGGLMQGFPALMDQQKFVEAEALVDRALKLLGESAGPNQSPGSEEASWIAYGARDADGRQQIFVVKPDGAGKKRLTQEGKQNFFPAWSPDGKRLAFTSDRSGSLQIWIMEADGGNSKQLTTEGVNVAPTWSPDGKRLAFGATRSGHFEIWAMDADGSHQKQLTKTDTAFSNNAAAWSPDGRRIAFSSTRSGNYAIWVMDADGGHLTQLTTPYGDRYPDSNAPAWSPDGKRIAFWSGIEHRYGNVWVMDSDGSNRKQLTDQPPGINCDEPAWSSDGSKILFASNRPGSEGIGNWIMKADGSDQGILTPNTYERGRSSWQPRPKPPFRAGSSIPAKNAANGFIALTLRDQTWRLQIFIIAPDGSQKQLTFEWDNGRPDWSPDGTKITFASIRNGASWVAVMAANGSTQKLLAEGKAPDWSPAGRQIAFSRSDGQIWVMNADGTNVRQITRSDAFKSGPSWSPDGKRMAFILTKNPGSKTDPQPEIGIVNSDGTNERILTTEDRTNVCKEPDGRENFLATAHDANAPAWSPVDNRIAIWSGIEGRYGQIWVINSDGTGSKQLTKECSRRNNDDPSWSPDGKKILFSTGRGGRNELWVMDADGSNEKRVSDIDAYPFPGRASWRPRH